MDFPALIPGKACPRQRSRESHSCRHSGRTIAGNPFDEDNGCRKDAIDREEGDYIRPI